MTRRDGLVLPAPGQTIVSGRGDCWKVIRTWEAGRRFGVIARLTREDGSTLVRTIDLSCPGAWKLRLDDRFSGEWMVCPECGARYGSVERCAWDDTRLVPLLIEDDA